MCFLYVFYEREVCRVTNEMQLNCKQFKRLFKTINIKELINNKKLFITILFNSQIRQIFPLLDPKF